MTRLKGFLEAQQVTEKVHSLRAAHRVEGLVFLHFHGDFSTILHMQRDFEDACDVQKTGN